MRVAYSQPNMTNVHRTGAISGERIGLCNVYSHVLRVIGRPECGIIEGLQGST
jgi:hypothetical protein